MPEYRPIAGRALTAKVQLHAETMKLMYRRMLQEAGVDCLFYSKMIGAAVEDGHIEAVLVSCLEGLIWFFADSFVAYILWPEEMVANAPTVYRHIETCLHDLEETNHE